MTQTNTTTTTTLTRANRVTVNCVEGNYRADFYRTHRHIATINSADLHSNWMPNVPEGTKPTVSALREAFRTHCILMAANHGIDWRPENLQPEGQRRLAKYNTEIEVGIDTVAMVQTDIAEFVAAYGDSIKSHTIEATSDLMPVTQTAKGTDVTTLGCDENGRYLKDGAIAWAIQTWSVTVQTDSGEYYIPFTVRVVSGQLTKPKVMGNNSQNWSKAGFALAVRDELIAAGVIDPAKEQDAKDAAKAAKKAAKAPKAEEAKPEAPKPEAPKGKGKGGKGKKEQAA